jgi:hypothetical protein
VAGWLTVPYSPSGVPISAHRRVGGRPPLLGQTPVALPIIGADLLLGGAIAFLHLK